MPELPTLFIGSLLTAGIFVLPKRSVLNMSVSKYQILQEVRELVPLAARQLQMMLEDPRTPPAMRKQLIEIALQYLRIFE